MLNCGILSYLQKPEQREFTSMAKADNNTRDYLDFGESIYAKKGFMKGRYEFWVKQLSGV